MTSDNERRRAIIAGAKPTPQSKGFVFTLRIGGYQADGHFALDNPDVPNSTLHCSDGLVAVSEFAKLLHAMEVRISRIGTGAAAARTKRLVKRRR